MGPEFERWNSAYTDRNAPIVSGDLVRLHVSYPDGVSALIKELFATKDGRWWGQCYDGLFPIGTLVQPFAIEKVVALDESRCVSDNFVPWPLRKASAEEAAHYKSQFDEAAQKHGYDGWRLGVAFPGLEFINWYSPKCRREIYGITS